MILNKKEAGNYSSKLKSLADDIKNSLVGYGAEGIYSKTIKTDKEEIRLITGKDYKDDTETIASERVSESFKILDNGETDKDRM